MIGGRHPLGGCTVLPEQEDPGGVRGRAGHLRETAQRSESVACGGQVVMAR